MGFIVLLLISCSRNLTMSGIKVIFQEQFKDCWSYTFGVTVQFNLTYEFWNAQEGGYRQNKQVQNLGQGVFGKMNTFV